MGFAESLPVQRVKPVIALAPFQGGLRDHSPNENHTVNTGGTWATVNGADGFSNGYLTATADPSLMCNELTIFASVGAEFSYGGLYEYILRLTDDSFYWNLYTGRSVAIAYDGTDASTYAHNYDEADSIAMTLTVGPAKPQFYENGAWSGEGNNDLTLAMNQVDWEIFGTSGGAYPWLSAGKVLLVYNEVLTAAEILALHDFCEARSTPHHGHNTNRGVYKDNIQTARVSLAAEDEGTVSNTGYFIDSGSWRVQEDDAGRYIECIGAGMLRRESLQGYGHWKFRFLHSGGVGRIIFFADSIGREGVDGRYYLEFTGANTRLVLRKSIAGTPSSMFFTEDLYITDYRAYEYTIERTSDGEITVWIQGGQYQDFTLVAPTFGTNPVTDNTNTDCLFVTYWLQAGDKIYLDEARPL